MTLHQGRRLRLLPAARDLAAAAVAVVAGLLIAFVDSRPGWDAAGITVGSLVAASFIAALISGHWPWLWALLSGVWIPLVELPAPASAESAGPAPLAALVFTMTGAVIGWAVTRAMHTE